MSLEVQNGRAVLFGIKNDGSPITIEGYATFILTDGKLDHKFKVTEVTEENESDATLIGTNEHYETTITWTPAGATRAAAVDTVVFPVPLKKLVMTHYAVDLLNGDWIYMGDGTVNITQGVGKMSLKVRKYVDADQNTLLSTTVQG